MQLIGIGIDLVDIASFTTIYGSEQTDLSRVFSHEEISYAGDGADKFIYLAARFAAKEAALKALGCGIQDGISFTDLVVAKLASGAPVLHLSGGALLEANRLGIGGWLISLTHSDATVGAVAVAFAGAGPR